MRHLAFAIVLMTAAAGASERGSLEFCFGGGAWIPGLIDSGSELQAGPAVSLSLEIPMDQGNIVFLRTGFRYASTDRPGWESVYAVPLVIGYRMYPFYKPYAGSRGLEPLLGFYGGGLLAWDSTDAESLETTTSGAVVIGLELGARVKISGSASIDVVIRPEWVPFGGELAGEEKKSLSGLVIFTGIAF